ncbi:MAG: type IV pilin [Halanaeroarchaeum sp.]
MTRKLELFDTEDTRAVSPVIGVILMVAITVILAAVIGTFVLGLGQNVSTATPQAQLTLSADSNNITINHQGGDPIPAGEIKITVSNSSNGEIAVFNPATDATQELTVGDAGVLYMTNSSVATLHWPTYVPSGNANNSVGELTTGTPYTVTIVHEPSDQLLLERQIRP